MKSDENVVNFFHDICPNFNLRFSNQNEKLIVVLANGTENFTMSESEDIETLFVQQNLAQLGDKDVKYISTIYDYDR